MIMGKNEQWFSRAEMAQARRQPSRGLVSLVTEVDHIDPLAWFDAGNRVGFTQRQYWRDAEDQLTLVGLGEALRLEAPLREAEAMQTRWRQQMGEGTDTDPPLATGAVALGGFRFAAESGHEHPGIWATWPSGRLVVPQWLLTRRANRTWITLNQGVDAWGVARTEDLFQRQRDLHTALTESHPGQGGLGNAGEPPSLRLDRVDRAAWVEAVNQIAQDIERGDLLKVVLARVLAVESASDWDLARVVASLSQNQVGTYRFAWVQGNQAFVGATPERLVECRDGRIATVCLAGSAPRGDTIAMDRRLGQELLADAKNLREHDIVVGQVAQAVAQFADAMEVSKVELVRWPDIQHLRTTIAARARSGDAILSAVAHLHPTPAVLGWPQAPAWAEILRHEPFDRGWYAAPVGWMDAHGQGEFAVAIRSGLFDRRQAWLYAGAGLVAQSEGESEFEETTWKFSTMLQALGEVRGD